MLLLWTECRSGPDLQTCDDNNKHSHAYFLSSHPHPRTTPQALRQSGLLVEAPKFSKFLHGMALLYPHRLRNTPHWFLPEPDSEDKGEPEAGPADDTAAGTGGAAAVGGWLARRGGSRWRGGAASRLLAPKRLGALGRLPPRMSPATLEELADPWDKYEQVGTACRTAVLLHGPQYTWAMCKERSARKHEQVGKWWVGHGYRGLFSLLSVHQLVPYCSRVLCVLLLLLLQEVPRWLFPPTIRADQAADITPDEDAAIFTDHSGEHHHHHSQDTERGVHSKKVGAP